MSKLTEALAREAQQGWVRHWTQPAWLKYVETGDTKYLAQLKKAQENTYMPSSIAEAIGTPETLTEEGRRLLRAIAATCDVSAFAAWIRKMPVASPELAAEAGLRMAAELNVFQDEVVSLLFAAETPLTNSTGQLTAAGKRLCQLSAADFARFLDRVDPFRIANLGSFLAVHAPKTWREAVEPWLESKVVAEGTHALWKVMAAANPKVFLPVAQKAFKRLTTERERFRLGTYLASVTPGPIERETEELARKFLATPWDWYNREPITEAGAWLANHPSKENLELLRRFFAQPLTARENLHAEESETRVAILKAASEQLGPKVVPLLEACFQSPAPITQLAALEQWIALRNPAQIDAIAAKFPTLLSGTDPTVVARALRLAANFDLPRLETHVWPLLAHKSRAVRQAAAVALARLGDLRVDRAAEAWAAKKADTRLAVVSWLKGVGTPAALAALQAQLDAEENDDVRDAILLALDEAGSGAHANPTELKRRIQATLARHTAPPAKWLAIKKLPAARLASGRELDADTLLYLLLRQSRVKEMRADVEARPLYAQIDRATSGDLALTVLEAWDGAGADADHRWVLAFAALLGDDRLVPRLTRQIRDWAEAARGKLAEYAVQALALLGTDAALLAVDTLAIRYRSKFKNIGKAAAEAFADAAAARGLTPEELGDRVVPWLGFEPGHPRLLHCGKATVEVRVGNDFKFAFRDTATGKKLAKLPDSAPSDLKAEFKELAASLKEAAKSQQLRLEALMVRQFRWTPARWRELFTRHPLLIPFAQRLVWGHFNPEGALTASFRALDDLSLTDVADESFALPATGQVGVVHPLELPAATRLAWTRHLADYAVEPPFSQLDRAVVSVKPEQAAQKFSKEFAGTELNALTFRGRAERLGWSRGSVCDAGGVNFYRKTFPTAGVEVFLGLEGMFVGVGMDDEVTLADAFFVQSGSVKIGSYEYDEPANDSDARLVPFGAVPPIAFSEALGDLARIAGKEPGANPDAAAE